MCCDVEVCGYRNKETSSLALMFENERFWYDGARTFIRSLGHLTDAVEAEDFIKDVMEELTETVLGARKRTREQTEMYQRWIIDIGSYWRADWSELSDVLNRLSLGN